MSNRAHLSRLVQDAEGNALGNVQVTVYETDGTTLVGVDIFADDTSATTLTNPFPVTTGTIEFYLTKPRRVNLLVQAEGQVPVEYPNVDVGAPASFVDSVRLRAEDGVTFWNLTVLTDGTLKLTSDDAATVHTFLHDT